MKVIVNQTGETYHVEKEVGQLLIAISYGYKLSEYREPVPAAKPVIEWSIGATTPHDGSAHSDEPFISATSSAGKEAFYGILSAPPKYRGETCPAELFQAYQEKRMAWSPDSAISEHNIEIERQRLGRAFDDIDQWSIPQVRPSR